MELGQKGDRYWTGQVEILRLEAASWIARAEGKNEDALALAKKAVDLEASTDKHPVTPGSILPARELYGDLLLELGRPAAALPEYEASLTTSPNRLHGLVGAARAAKGAGDQAKAKASYDRAAALTRGAETRRPEVLEARAAAARAD